MAASASDKKTGEPDLVEDLEMAFQNCISLLTTQEHFNVTDSEETKTGIEHALQRFLDVARQMEAFFLRRRMILSIQKPEQVIKEEYSDLENELNRKDVLLQKHQQRLQHWQNLLCNMQTAPQQQQQSSQGSMPNMATSQNLHPQQATNMPNMTPYQPQQPLSSQSLVMPPPQPPQTYPQTPLAYLEQSMSNIGLPERR